MDTNEQAKEIISSSSPNSRSGERGRRVVDAITIRANGGCLAREGRPGSDLAETWDSDGAQVYTVSCSKYQATCTNEV